MATTDHISVCICTYHRNDSLRWLLRNLARQKTDGLFEYSIVVVDNDPGGHARDTVAEIRAETGLDITYSIEPEHSIPAARNHALRLARGNYIAIIDDDEFPGLDWLLRLYQGVITFAVDGVLGPVHPFFALPPPSWLIRSKICEAPVHRTGTILHWSQTFTNNALVKRSIFNHHGLAFDIRFRTGGSDQELFRQAMARGCRFVAIAEAPVFEVLPPSRWTRKYWIKRALVNGYNSRRYLPGRHTSSKQMIATIKSIIAFSAYLLLLPFCIGLGQHRMIVCLEKSSYHLSRALGGFGIEIWKKRDF